MKNLNTRLKKCEGLVLSQQEKIIIGFSQIMVNSLSQAERETMIAWLERNLAKPGWERLIPETEGEKALAVKFDSLWPQFLRYHPEFNLGYRPNFSGIATGEKKSNTC